MSASEVILNLNQDERDRFAAAAIKAGFESGKGPGIGPWLRSLGEREIAAKDESAWAQHQAALERVGRELAKPQPVFRRASEPVTFESMTAGERRYFLTEVLDRHVAGPATRTASDIINSSLLDVSGIPSLERYPSPSAPGYQARYDAALAYVKGVIDAGE